MPRGELYSPLFRLCTWVIPRTVDPGEAGPRPFLALPPLPLLILRRGAGSCTSFRKSFITSLHLRSLVALLLGMTLFLPSIIEINASTIIDGAHVSH